MPVAILDAERFPSEGTLSCSKRGVDSAGALSLQRWCHQAHYPIRSQATRDQKRPANGCQGGKNAGLASTLGQKPTMQSTRAPIMQGPGQEQAGSLENHRSDLAGCRLSRLAEGNRQHPKRLRLYQIESLSETTDSGFPKLDQVSASASCQSAISVAF